MDIDNVHGFLPKINRLTDWLNCEQSSPVEADEVTNLRNQEDACVTVLNRQLNTVMAVLLALVRPMVSLVV